MGRRQSRAALALKTTRTCHRFVLTVPATPQRLQARLLSFLRAEACLGFEGANNLVVQVVELPEEAIGADDALPTVVQEPAAPSQPKLSWRQKAAQLKAQREAQNGS